MSSSDDPFYEMELLADRCWYTCGGTPWYTGARTGYCVPFRTAGTISRRF